MQDSFQDVNPGDHASFAVDSASRKGLPSERRTTRMLAIGILGIFALAGALTFGNVTTWSGFGTDNADQAAETTMPRVSRGVPTGNGERVDARWHRIPQAD